MEVVDSQNTNNSNGELNKSPLLLYIEKREKEWSENLASIAEKMKTLKGILDNESELYNIRQSCLESYHQVLRMISKKTQQLRPLQAQRYNFYKVNSQIRYSSDTAIGAQVNSDLTDYIYDIELLNNHGKFLQDTLKGIDSMIYSIKNRIELEKLVRGFDL